MHAVDHYVGMARSQVSDLVEKLVGSAASSAGQTMTIARPRAEVEQFWREPENLSRVLGDLAEVRSGPSGSYVWTLRPADGEAVSWNTELVRDDNGLRFIGARAGDAEPMEVRLEFADAPADLGTEVRLEAHTPLPDLLTGAAAFTALYRARALLQTGEIPTLAHNPSARRSPAST
ncbi:hypothetical protein NDR87_15100 [Nocardia sp. CDC159]|uniref:Cyclase n=1 Tax=Nocardia pulmonis TaxID=2951408 RepID=A0A9X2IX32_9NOCA|nr:MULTISPECIES: hypothetical protein [Nocardia]MCM6775582.1 hypothetical protein [Nocardia pulmonis]MCM6787684.1 hypothetical protein [Nocardia sp. CDC159]